MHSYSIKLGSMTSQVLFLAATIVGPFKSMLQSEVVSLPEILLASLSVLLDILDGV